MDPEDKIVEKIRAIYREKGEEVSDEQVYKEAQNLKELAEFLVKMTIKDVEKKKSKID